MKTLILLLTKVLSAIAASVNFIWIVVEFLIYLVKDDPFNWNSVWLFITCIVLTIALWIIIAVMLYKHKEAKRETKQVRTKSRWQERLEEAAKQRGYNAESK